MSPSTVSWRTIKTELTGMDTDSLISLIHDLYALNKVNKEFLQGRVGGEAAYATLHENAAKKIRHEFFPERGFGKVKIEPIKKAIHGYKKVTGDLKGTADLILLFIDLFVKYCREYSGMEETKLGSLSVAIKELYQILETCPSIIQDLDIEERLVKVEKDASKCGYGIDSNISFLRDDIEDLL